MKILIVDDAPEILKVTSRFVEIFTGKKPVSVDNGKKAIEILKSFDLLVTDWDMPEISGKELVEYASSIPHLRIIVYSASDIPEEQKFSTVHYFKKPYDILKIKNFIQNF